jgi:limonene-1,2-epoxide hydrolase
MAAEHEQVVRAFMEACNGVPDADRLAAFFAERSFFYPNREWSPYVGREGIRARWMNLKVKDVSVEVLHIASVANTVFVERVDRFTRTDTGERIEMAVAGAGEVNNDGLIVRWRDYFPTSPPPRVLP